MILHEEEIRRESILNMAQEIAIAIRTAPKARGTDNLSIAIVTDDTIKILADKMRQIGTEQNLDFFKRDADNIMQSEAVILIGTKISPLGLNCRYCGFETCSVKPHDVPCFFNANDLGIAIGSAASKAADLRLDNRVMFSAGNAAMQMNMLPNCSVILAIPLTARGKSPFFDRK